MRREVLLAIYILCKSDEGNCNFSNFSNIFMILEVWAMVAISGFFKWGQNV